MAKIKHQHDGYHCSRGEIFSGPHSEDMWEEINSAKTVKSLASALYFVCCRIQELESKFERIAKKSGGQAGEGEG